MMFELASSWKKVLSPELEKPYFNQLLEFLKTEYDQQVVYPKKENVFSAFNLTPFEDVKVVIIGQDPYHGVNQANGLCFSVHADRKSTRLNSSHVRISYAVFCLKKKNTY